MFFHRNEWCENAVDVRFGLQNVMRALRGCFCNRSVWCKNEADVTFSLQKVVRALRFFLLETSGVKMKQT